MATHQKFQRCTTINVVRLGEKISHKLYSAKLENMYCKLDLNKQNLSMNGKYLCHLRFATVEWQELINDSDATRNAIGLKMNLAKTKIRYKSLVICPRHRRHRSFVKLIWKFGH